MKGTLTIILYLVVSVVVYAGLSWVGAWPVLKFWNEVAAAKWGVFHPITFGQAWWITISTFLVIGSAFMVGIALWESRKKGEVEKPN